jgi:hypothetical protein
MQASVLSRKFIGKQPQIPFDYALSKILREGSVVPTGLRLRLGTLTQGSPFAVLRVHPGLFSSSPSGGFSDPHWDGFLCVLVDRKQILRLTTPNLHPTDEDLSVGTPVENVWGPFRSG